MKCLKGIKKAARELNGYPRYVTGLIELAICNRLGNIQNFKKELFILF
jgi:hypothetical protein